MRINLGSYNDYRTGWINVEHPKNAKLVRADVYHDLNRFPYPFKDSAASEIHVIHTLEHLDDTIRVIDECWRILKPGGILKVIVPHCTNCNSYGDITHKHVFAFSSMDYFTGSSVYDYYSTKHWKKVRARLVWRKIAGRRLGPIFDKISPLVDAVINLSPYFTEAFLVYYLGGISEVRWEMTPVKKA